MARVVCPRINGRAHLRTGGGRIAHPQSIECDQHGGTYIGNHGHPHAAEPGDDK